MDREHYPWEELFSYLHAAAQTLGLTEWSFEISRELPEQEGAAATCFIPKNRKFANIRFHDMFFNDYTPEQRRAVVYHELMHCVFSLVWQHVILIQDHLNPPTWALFRDGVDQEEERLCDAMAEAIAPQLAPPLKLKVPKRPAAPSARPAGRVVSRPTRTRGSEPETPEA